MLGCIWRPATCRRRRQGGRRQNIGKNTIQSAIFATRSPIALMRCVPPLPRNASSGFIRSQTVRPSMRFGARHPAVRNHFVELGAANTAIADRLGGATVLGCEAQRQASNGGGARHQTQQPGTCFRVTSFALSPSLINSARTTQLRMTSLLFNASSTDLFAFIAAPSLECIAIGSN